jgi:hypothetical protein
LNLDDPPLPLVLLGELVSDRYGCCDRFSRTNVPIEPSNRCRTTR